MKYYILLAGLVSLTALTIYLIDRLMGSKKASKLIPVVAFGLVCLLALIFRTGMQLIVLMAA